MICLLCRRAGIFEGRTSILFQRGELHLTVNKVPARVCPACGEAYVDEEVTTQVLQQVEKIEQAGVPVDAIDYEERPAD